MWTKCYIPFIAFTTTIIITEFEFEDSNINWKLYKNTLGIYSILNIKYTKIQLTLLNNFLPLECIYEKMLYLYYTKSHITSLTLPNNFFP
jgi:hypothetical protein